MPWRHWCWELSRYSCLCKRSVSAAWSDLLWRSSGFIKPKLHSPMHSILWPGQEKFSQSLRCLFGPLPHRFNRFMIGVETWVATCITPSVLTTRVTDAAFLVIGPSQSFPFSGPGLYGPVLFQSLSVVRIQLILLFIAHTAGIATLLKGDCSMRLIGNSSGWSLVGLSGCLYGSSLV